MLTSKLESVRKAAALLRQTALISLGVTALVVGYLWYSQSQLGLNGETIISCIGALGVMISMAFFVVSMMMYERAAEGEVLSRISGALQADLKSADTVANRR